jgi:hypothetical protein
MLGLTSVMSDANGEARTNLTTTAKAVVSAAVAGGTSGSVKSDNLSIPVRIGPTISVNVTSPSNVPGAPSTFSVTVTAGGAVVRSATIDFGDGSSQGVGTTGVSTASHVYDRSGTFIVTATAIDAAGETATASTSVSVQTVVVTVMLQVPATITTAATASFTALAQTNPSTAIVERYEWDFGDGSIRTTSSGTTTHLYALGGGRRYFVTVRAVTTTGAAGSTTAEIVVQ